MNTNRLETFADGVFAIAATLLNLNADPGLRRCCFSEGLRVKVSGLHSPAHLAA
jgi:hypothetical protein